ncbi:hypothetical protein BY458DRAFT_57595 [Sporodiniella umbellata]|nr:hypothetical protein BY458DRAFT_57595 [Sporodiniella umbellata]
MNPDDDSSLTVENVTSPNLADLNSDPPMSSDFAGLANRPSSRHYFYRKASLPNSVTPVNEDASTLEFESKLSVFVQRPSIQQTAQDVQEASQVELTRRRAERRARKEKEKRANVKPADEVPYTGPLFSKLNQLMPIEKSAWLANIHDEAMLLNPHQWLKLGSLFNVNSKVTRQTSVLPGLDHHPKVLKDRGIGLEQVRSLENYLELRDVQNRNYARDSVSEGAKLIKMNKVKEAMEHYKRALDMDPKYADGWLHVAEALIQQKKLKEAGEQLDKVLKLEPEHENAKALLASVNYALDPKPQKKDEWDLVDEDGYDISSDRKKRDLSPLKKRSRSRSPYHRRKRSRSRSPSDRHSRRKSRSLSNRRSKRRGSQSEGERRKRKDSRSPSDRRTRQKSTDKRKKKRSRSPSNSNDIRNSSRERWRRSKDADKDRSRERRRDSSRGKRRDASKERLLDKRRDISRQRGASDDFKESSKESCRHERRHEALKDRSRSSRKRNYERRYEDTSVDSENNTTHSPDKRCSQRKKRYTIRSPSRDRKFPRSKESNTDLTKKISEKAKPIDVQLEIPKNKNSPTST